MAGRNLVCRRSRLIVSSVLGEFGKVCVVILPGTMALCYCKNIRPQAEVQRSFLEDPAGTFPLAGAWQSDGEAGRVCVCVHRPSEGLAASPKVCCVPVCRSGPQSIQVSYALAEHHVEPPSASQE